MNTKSLINIEKFYPQMIIKSVEENDTNYHIYLKSITKNQKCPCCGKETNRYHSTYKRKVQDLPILGKNVNLNIIAYKYYCDNEECKQKEFCESIDNFISPQRRMTNRLEDFIVLLAVNSSCEGAARICKTIGINTNGDSIIRLLKLRVKTIPVVSASEVIGIDDWAYKKGQKYGTIIVDEATHKPIELLDGRDGVELKEWLKQNKQVKIITRDRASAYAAAISEVLPDVIQIADRFHLYENLLKLINDVLKENIPSRIKVYLSGDPNDKSDESENENLINDKKKRNKSKN